jgi:hypothetical protein
MKEARDEFGQNGDNDAERQHVEQNCYEDETERGMAFGWQT